jgi:hypothetical protein
LDGRLIEACSWLDGEIKISLLPDWMAIKSPRIWLDDGIKLSCFWLGWQKSKPASHWMAEINKPAPDGMAIKSTRFWLDDGKNYPASDWDGSNLSLLLIGWRNKITASLLLTRWQNNLRLPLLGWPNNQKLLLIGWRN